jgi:hypothetical protein
MSRAAAHRFVGADKEGLSMDGAVTLGREGADRRHMRRRAGQYTEDLDREEASRQAGHRARPYGWTPQAGRMQHYLRRAMADARSVAGRRLWPLMAPHRARVGVMPREAAQEPADNVHRAVPGQRTSRHGVGAWRSWVDDLAAMPGPWEQADEQEDLWMALGDEVFRAQVTAGDRDIRLCMREWRYERGRETRWCDGLPPPGNPDRSGRGRDPNTLVPGVRNEHFSFGRRGGSNFVPGTMFGHPCPWEGAQEARLYVLGRHTETPRRPYPSQARGPVRHPELIGNHVGWYVDKVKEMPRRVQSLEDDMLRQAIVTCLVSAPRYEVPVIPTVQRWYLFAGNRVQIDTLGQLC